MRTLLGTLIAAGWAGASACQRDSTGPDVSPKVAACDTVGTATISPGPTPTIAWSAPCALGTLVVFRAADTAQMWGAFNEDNQLVSPVTYGVLPKNARPGSAAIPLVPGQTYRLLLGYNPPAPAGTVVRFLTVLSRQEFVP